MTLEQARDLFIDVHPEYFTTKDQHMEWEDHIDGIIDMMLRMGYRYNDCNEVFSEGS